MNILFLVSQLPFPADTGAKIRTCNLIKQTAAKHRITLVTYGNEQKDVLKIEALNKYCRSIYLVDLRKRQPWLAVLLNFFSRLPYNIEKYYSPRMEKLIQKLLAENIYDLIHCDSLQVSYNILNVKNIPKVLTEHNIESQIIKRYSDNENNFFKKAVIYYQYEKLLKYEKNACRLFNYIGVVSMEDKLLLEQIADVPDIHIIANGVDLEYFKFHGTHDEIVEKKTLIFTGSLDWLPNEDGLLYFFTQIYPLLKLKIPEIQITVVGKNPGEKIIGTAKSDPSVILTGGVDDVRPYVRRGEVFIVPLRIGGGTRLKILEAMSAGKPVVSTTIGAEGISVCSGRDILLADSPESFVESICALFDDRELQNRILENARKKVETEYSWDIIAQELIAMWTKAAQTKC